jgi:hypothetical protein
VELRAPALFGVKVKVTLQVELAATVPLQLFVAVKSVESVSVPLVSVMALEVELVMTEMALEDVLPTAVAVNAWVVGEIDKLPPEPVPVRWMTWVAAAAFSALSVKVRVPLFVPATAGVKLML